MYLVLYLVVALQSRVYKKTTDHLDRLMREAEMKKNIMVFGVSLCRP